jgi:heptosyltransferase-2
MRIAIFCPNWVGDAVMATPTLRAIRESFAGSKITGVMRPGVAGVFEALDLFDTWMLHNPRGQIPDERGWRFACRLRRCRFDVAVLFPNSFRTAMLAMLSGARRRIGYNRNGRGWMLTDRLSPRSRRVPHPVIDEYLRLAVHLGCGDLSRRIELATTIADENHLDQFWRKQAATLDASRGVICVNPGGAFGSAKHWPATSFAALAKLISVRLHKTVLVLCGPAERGAARDIVQLADDPFVVSLADEPVSLGLSKAAVSRSDLLITTDSGPRHFAPAFGTPVVTLFGPTHIAWSETFYDRAMHLQVGVDCGPCQRRVCPLQHHRCMRDLSVDQVFRAAVAMLDRFPCRAAA